MLPPKNITAEQARQLQDPVFLDVRIPDAWDQATDTVSGAIRLPPAEVENHLRWIPQGRPVVTYADRGHEFSSVRAAEALIQNGWRDVHPLEGGFQAWLQSGFPTEPKSRLAVDVD